MYAEINRFDFGVPLEDCCPPNGIHPRLLRLFEHIIQGVWSSTSVDLQEVLNYQCGSVRDKIALKNDLVNATQLRYYPLGASFWVLRNFFELLPIPLLPKYANGETFHWNLLAIRRCDVVRSLRRLPEAHKNALEVLIEFFQVLKSFGLSLRELSQYFANSLFQSTTNTRRYTYLLLYIIVRWPKLHPDGYKFPKTIEAECQTEEESLQFHTALDFERFPTITEETSDQTCKVEEEYFYDDYDTFNKEEFNQVGGIAEEEIQEFANPVDCDSPVEQTKEEAVDYKCSEVDKTPQQTNSSVEQVSEGIEEVSYYKWPEVDEMIGPPNEEETVYMSLPNFNEKSPAIASMGQKLFACSTPRSDNGLVLGSMECLQTENRPKMAEFMKKSCRKLGSRFRQVVTFWRTMDTSKKWKSLKVLSYHKI